MAFCFIFTAILYINSTMSGRGVVCTSIVQLHFSANNGFLNITSLYLIRSIF